MADERDELDEVLDAIPIALAYVPMDESDRANGEAIIARARSIRARERKLAELAHAMAAHLDGTNRPLTTYQRQWAERYEEACR